MTIHGKFSSPLVVTCMSGKSATILGRTPSGKLYGYCEGFAGSVYWDHDRRATMAGGRRLPSADVSYGQEWPVNFIKHKNVGEE